MGVMRRGIESTFSSLFLFEMANFKIAYGIGGGYNVIDEEVIEADTLDEANEIAYQCAVDTFERYGVFEKHNDVEEFENDDDYQAAYHEEVERWTTYYAEEIA